MPINSTELEKQQKIFGESFWTPGGAVFRVQRSLLVIIHEF